MQRRHAIIAAIALVALVLIPAAVLASGPAGGFGHRGAGPGPKNVSQTDGSWAGNATHPDWCAGDGPGNRTFHSNSTCAANLGCDRGTPRGLGDGTNPAGDQDRPRFRNRTAVNLTGTSASDRPLGPAGRAHHGQGR